MAWTDSWLRKLGWPYHKGNIHWLHRGYWFPEPPPEAGDASRCFIYIHKDMEAEELWFDTILFGKAEALMATSPAEADDALYQSMVAYDSALERAPSLGAYGARKSNRRIEYDGAISIHLSPMNNAWVGMWHEQVLRIFNTREEAEHWATQVTTPNVSLLHGRKKKLDGYGLTEWPKQCNTCKRWHTEVEWDRLPLIGKTVIEEDEEGPGYTLEMRNCECSSTLAIER